MRCLTFLLYQEVLLLISFNELPLFQNGAQHQVKARIMNKYTCQNDVMNINCASKVIRIYRAVYSRLESKICSNDVKTAEYCGALDKIGEVRRLCSGKASCNISVDEKTMGGHCPDVNTEYLNVIYDCHTPPNATAELPYIPNKSTMVLTKPSTPSLPLSTTPSKSRGAGSVKPTKQSLAVTLTEQDDEGSEGDVSNEVVHYVLLGGACICTYPTTFTLPLLISIVTIL